MRKAIFQAFRIAALAVCLTTTLAACAVAPIQFAEVGGTPQQFAMDNASCELEAARQVPPAPVYNVNPGFSSNVESCHKKQCSETALYLPPTVEVTDANAPLRNDVTRGCLGRKGWLEIKAP